MLEFLTNIPAKVAAPAIHHAIQWISQWASARRGARDFAMDDDPALDAEARALIVRIIEAIEQEEKKSIASFDGAKQRGYIEQLSDHLLKLSKHEARAHPSSGMSALEKLRQMRI